MRGRLLLAVAASVLVVLASPFVGEINTFVERTFPDRYVAIVLAAVVLPAVVAVVAAMARIQDRRALRYGLLMAAASIAVAYTTAMETTRTEQFHFTEYGLLALLFYRAWHWRGDASVIVLAACAAVIAGFADEWFQWFVPSRVGEARDVVLNSVGAVCGLLIAFAMMPVGAVADARARRAIAAGLACVVLAGALFLQSVHLGYEIEDAEAGRFRSRYAAPALSELSAARAGQWRRDPPGTVPPMSREDHFLSEGRFHIQWRNTAASSGDLWTAWKENLILEKFYAPVLDYGLPGSRWPDEQREQIRTAAAADIRPYASAAYPFPIYAWSRPWFWGITFSLVAALWLAAR